MTTTDWMDRLSEYLDGTLTPEEQVACEAWLSSSAEGRELLQDLRRVVAQAKTLPEAPVPDAVWAGISAGIRSSANGATVLPLEPARRLAVLPPRRWQFSPLQLAAAAVVLLAVGLGFGLRFRGVPNAPIADAGPGGAQVGTGVKLTPIAQHAEASYDKAVAELQIILDENRGTMDTATVRVLESSLARINEALDEAQKALASDPHNSYLNDHLGRIKRKKLDLLRQGASLVQAS
ncbi:MAG TPA: hypothetical protein VL295_04235 [Gemmatimonadales bacterium]|jgi:hypothetical protein|nr:hypothetical protein [Gemmatimonadales bacterium]